MKKLKLALDWTPNTNHTGFFVAREMGFYEEMQLDVAFVTPSEDNYATTPAKKVEQGDVDFALCPMESVLSYRTKENTFDLVALAALLHEDLSAIAVLQSSGIESPKALDGKTYASYKARYEDGIVKQMIINAGGSGDLELVYPDKLGIWEILLKNNASATWIFSNWEGLQAEKAGIALKLFKMKDFGIPYSYSPVIAASAGQIEKNKEAYTHFLEATKKGFLYAIEHPEQAVSILKPHLGAQEKPIDLLKSQKLTNRAYGNSKNWGNINLEQVKEFITWLQTNNLENAILQIDQLIDTSLLNK